MKKILIAGVVALSLAVSATASAAFTRNLTVGSQGTDVAELQSWLISKGYSIPSISSGAVAPGYFGAQTKTALTAYQAANGIPATGFFGPLTMASVNAGGSVAGGSGSCPAGFNCSPVNTTPTCPVGFVCSPIGGGTPVQGSTLEGTDGTIEAVNELSQYNNEEVGDGESDVKVVGFEIETSNDGDVLLRSIKLAIDPSGNGAGDSDHLDDYIDAVTVWMGDKEIGSANASDFDEGSTDIYTKTITLSGSPIVEADSVEKFYITVDAVNNLDSGDIDSDSWTVDIDNIRYEDGSGVVTTLAEADFGGDTFNVPISFVSFSTAANTELKVSKDSSSPEDGIVVVDEDDDTDGVVLLVGEIEIEGTSDVTIDELPITLTTNGDSVGAVTGTLVLKIDGEEYTESVGLTTVQAGTVTFDNLDLVIEGGDTVTFTVEADINDTNNTGVTATDFDEGDYLIASLTSTNRDNIDAENEEGDQLDTSSERSGTATGEAQEFRTQGIGLTLVSTATDATTGTSANDDIGLFTIKYKVTAIGDTIYVSSLATSAGVTYTVDKSGTATTSNSITGAIVNNDDTTLTATGNYEIEEGESETFTLSVAVPLGAQGTSGQYRLALTGVKWDTSDDTSLDNTYSSALDEFKTAYKVLN
jgi:peptidoglycan hydrolase-like protein with peptidoglycan-binding domain